MSRSEPGAHALSRRPSRSASMSTFSQEVFDNEVVPSSLGSIAPICRVAAEIESERPRVAYLCRFYVFVKADRLDPSSTGRGVWQFKTSLQQRLERDNAPSLASRIKKSDAREIESFYQQYYEHYVRAFDKGEEADRAQLGKAYQTAGVLFEVLCAVNKTEKVEEVAPEIIAAAIDVQEKKEIYTPYNILPLDAAGASQAIMQLEEVKAAVAALWNTRGLNWPTSFEQNRKKSGDLDLLDWLRAMFGFQRDNVRNQREHLILLLANDHIRLVPKPEPLNKLDERAIDAVMNKLFKNYKTWCKFLGRKHSLRLPQGHPEVQQRKILYMGLYLLIWGEAANVRFMPECLCYIFHNMAFELHGLIAGNVSIVTGENIKPSYGGDDEAFLRKVITPLYRVIEKEAKKSRNGKAPHSAWCNYDDLNEYFWLADCFSLGWPMCDDGAFFKSTSEGREVTQASQSSCKQSQKSTGKTNFVETRTFWHIFRSFDRLWTFYILTFQAMVIVAWSGSSPLDIFRKDILFLFLVSSSQQPSYVSFKVIAIRDVIRPPNPKAFNDVYISTELMDTDLHQIIRSNQELSEEHSQYFLYQILRGLKYIHSANVIHRDLKPSNLLLNANCDLKICDFGLARPTSENEFMTEYVVTRWYRAPELLLNSTDYTAAIDVWSVGCIFMELMNRKPLFAGRDHMHQMRLLTELIGTPTEAELGFVRSEEARRYIQQLPRHPHQSLPKVFPHVHPVAMDLVERMLTFDPTKRITVEEALAHPYFARLHDLADEPICSKPFSFDFEHQALVEEQMKELIYKEAISLNPEYGQ